MRDKYARMRILEGLSAWRQHRTLAGLIALLETGRLSVKELSDEELERIIIGLPGGAINRRHLSDDELVAIANGGQQ